MEQIEYFRRLIAVLPGALPVVLAGSLLLLAACGGDDASPTGDGSGSPIGSPGGTANIPAECITRGDLGGLLTTLQFDSEPGVYEPGEEVDMSFSLINCDDDAERLFYSTTQRYVFIIERLPDSNDFSAVGIEVWRSSDGKAFEQTKGEEVIEKNETVLYMETWDQTDTGNDEEVSEGLYRVSAFSVGCAVIDQTECRFGPVSYLEIASGDN